MNPFQPSDDQRYRTQEVLWEPDPNGYGPRRARAPVRIQAYLPDSLNSQQWRFSSEVTAALGDAQAEITSAQQHADRIGPNTVAQQLLRSESMASSQMEGLVVPSHRSLAKAEIGLVAEVFGDGDPKLLADPEGGRLVSRGQEDRELVAAESGEDAVLGCGVTERQRG